MPTNLLVIARGVQIGASLLVAGVFTFEIVVARVGRRPAAQANPAEGRLHRLALWSLAAAFFSALLWFAFEVVNEESTRRKKRNRTAAFFYSA